MEKRLFYILLFTFVFLLSYSNSYSGVISKGEELRYKVSYLGITLGYIDISVEGTDEVNNVNVFKAKAIIRSNPDIPFVELAANFESWIDRTLGYSHQYIGRIKLSDTTWDFHKIEFKYAEKKIRTQKWIKKDKIFDNVFYTSTKMNDGLSLFFLARKYIKLGRAVRIPTIVDKDTSDTIINFVNKKETSKIDSFDYDIATIYFYGKAEWQGIYGLTGAFEGWFSDDSENIPIRAKMKVYVGSIDIELVEWKRNNWKPPKAK